MSSSNARGESVMRPFFTVRTFLEETELSLTQLDRSVLLLVASFMDAETGTNGRPSSRRLAAVLGAATDSVSTSLRRMAEIGLLTATVEHPHRGQAQTWELGRLVKGPLHKAPLTKGRKDGWGNRERTVGEPSHRQYR